MAFLFALSPAAVLPRRPVPPSISGNSFAGNLMDKIGAPTKPRFCWETAAASIDEYRKAPFGELFFLQQLSCRKLAPSHKPSLLGRGRRTGTNFVLPQRWQMRKRWAEFFILYGQMADGGMGNPSPTMVCLELSKSCRGRVARPAKAYHYNGKPCKRQAFGRSIPTGALSPAPTTV